MGNGARRELEVDERDVRNISEETPASQSRNPCRALVKPVAQDREIVRREVPDDADIRLVQPEVHTAHRDEEDVAELSAADQVAAQVHRRAVKELEPGEDGELPLGRL